jgi:hypothetical protein
MTLHTVVVIIVIGLLTFLGAIYLQYRDAEERRIARRQRIDYHRRQLRRDRYREP